MDLTLADFEVFEDGKPQEIATFGAARRRADDESRRRVGHQRRHGRGGAAGCRRSGLGSVVGGRALLQAAQGFMAQTAR